MLHGRAIIDLHNTKTHRDERIVHDNLLTNWLRDIQKPLTIYGGQTASLGSLAKANSFGGIIMFGQTLSNDADDYLIPTHKTHTMIAHGDDQAYSGVDTTRGSFNASQSSESEGSITRVWDFTVEQGNGTIASLGLCHRFFGWIGSGANIADTSAANKPKIVDIFSKFSPYSNRVIETIDGSTYYGGAHYYDNTHGHTICASVVSGILYVKRNVAPFGVINPLRLALGTSSSFSESALPTIESYDLTAYFGTSGRMQGFIDDDGKLYLIQSGNVANGSSTTLVIFDLLAKTYTTKTVTNNTGKTAMFQSGAIGNVLSGFIVDDNILYCPDTNGNGIYINLNDNTDCGEILDSAGNAITINTSYYAAAFYKWGKFVIAASANIMVDVATYVYSLHKGTAKYIMLSRFAYGGYGQSTYGIGGQNIGKWIKAIGGAIGNSTATYNDLFFLTPALVTKNNLQSAVTKTGDMTMRVTYTVSDS